MMNATKFFSTVVTSLMVLTLLTSGGCSNDDENERIEKCGEGDIIRHGEYVLVNDDGSYSGYAVCIFDDFSTQTFGWTWGETKPDPQQSRTSTRAYIFYGQVTQGGGGPFALMGSGSTTPDLPASTENLTSIIIDYDVQISTTNRYRLGFSINNFLCYVGGCVGPYFSIQVYSDAPPSAAYFQQRIIIDGEEYDYYIDKSVSPFTGYVFVKVRPSLFGHLDVLKFLRVISDDVYNIDSIWMFQSIWEGGDGSTTIHRYAIDVKSREQ